MLRRVIAHFRRQEWTAIALDFFIVVFGVYIGIQVSNWNAARLEARQGEVFTQRLKADLRIEAWNYDVLVDYLRDVQTNADMALAILDGAPEACHECQNPPRQSHVRQPGNHGQTARHRRACRMILRPPSSMRSPGT